ncbi:cytochrome c biogenesis protein CcdA [Nitrogeniibacter mangrovi]|uniref:Cytochrome c biogenesis protein CcdA n=1 Tax=Nitrogeniibacter mangrovi TaxID=2016596 RepID=A0A6C1B2Q1_9RHOO|nr:cytochrome c biogenesis protein CcdA [Nitrogeniibacter mangrovi]QID17921.1 cytochrome c biogenesis protein CcdA [Nitrogeniibacter mangrovi]
MTEIGAIGLAGAVAAGMISFLSPCVLPLVPGYVSYVSGHAAHAPEEKTRLEQHVRSALLSLCFVLGFSVVFIALGASASVIGRLLLSFRTELNMLGGAIVIAFGLFMIKPFHRLRWLNRDMRFHPGIKGGRPAAAFTLGMAFGFGWTPCIGPILGVILTAGAMQSSLGGAVGLLAAYALGLGVPFVLAALFMRELTHRLKSLRRASRPLQVVGGSVMIVMGVAMVTGQLTAFSYWLLERFPVLGQIG